MGRIVVLSFLFATGIMGFAVYRAFKDSPAVKTSVANQLQSQLQGFLATLPSEQQTRIEFESIQKTESFGADSLPVVYRFFLLVKETWSIELHGKAIAITAPAIQVEVEPFNSVSTAFHEKHATALNALAKKKRDQMLDEARSTVSGILQKWLEVQFPREKTIELKIRFANEPALK